MHGYGRMPFHGHNGRMPGNIGAQFFNLTMDGCSPSTGLPMNAASPQATPMSDVRFQGQHAINNGVDSRATTVNVGVQDQQQHTSSGPGVPVANLLDHQAESDGTSVPSTLTESITSRGHPSERGLRDLLSEIWVECSDALEAIGCLLYTSPSPRD